MTNALASSVAPISRERTEDALASNKEYAGSPLIGTVIHMIRPISTVVPNISTGIPNISTVVPIIGTVIHRIRTPYRCSAYR